MVVGCILAVGKKEVPSLILCNMLPGRDNMADEGGVDLVRLAINLFPVLGGN